MRRKSKQYKHFLRFLKLDGEVIRTKEGYRAHTFGYGQAFATRKLLYARFKKEFPNG